MAGRDRSTRWLVVGLVVGLLAWVGARRRRARREAARALAERSVRAVPFDPEALALLPEPARRYLARALEAGVPLPRAAVLELGGRVRGGTGKPWRPLAVTRQVLDGAGEGGDVLPGRGNEARRAAWSWAALEALWLPSRLLPARGARWTPVDDRRAAVRFEVAGRPCTLVLAVDPDGRVEEARLQAEGAELVADTFLEEGRFQGVTVPTRFRVGWGLGSRGGVDLVQPVLRTVRFR
ncbi:MAG: hypothetical protein H6732_19380 [Alphaproteobacteria bacterium]|nr:hypothetical protein [Alphaproteobacteria bacterium]